MIQVIATVLLAASNIVTAQIAAYDSALVGTWSSKSNKTLTGPGFYDPVNDKLLEPSRTGISYSFTLDGHYEEAYYRAISNPVNPDCPSAIMQWQHGTYVKFANGSLQLTPIEVDGRQLVSSPCNGAASVYTIYNQSEFMERYEVFTDPYHNIPRLNLYRFDGSPIMPLYLAYSPPEMLPTTTLHPAPAASTHPPHARMVRRSSPGGEAGSSFKQGIDGKWSRRLSADFVWWLGIGITGLGGFLLICF